MSHHAFPLIHALQEAQAATRGPARASMFDHVPHDAVSIFVYLIVIGGLMGILWVGRPRKTPPPDA